MPRDKPMIKINEPRQKVSQKGQQTSVNRMEPVAIKAGKVLSIWKLFYI
jgi:hypothetical protein